MECSICGGRVEWKGWRFHNFTHTECLGCGAMNSQIVDGDQFMTDTEQEDFSDSDDDIGN